MALNKFDDFENNLEEEDKQAESTDFKSAKKALIDRSTDNSILHGPVYFADNEDDTIWATGPNEKDQLEKPIVVKILGFADWTFHKTK